MMHRFKSLTVEVQAARVPAGGQITIGGFDLIADSGTWIIIFEDGRRTTLTDAEFRKAFEPVDEEAAAYFFATESS